MGTDGTPLCQEDKKVDAPCAPVRPAASSQANPASLLEPGICWLSGVAKPMRHTAGTETGSLWAQPSRCTGLCEMNASWTWYMDGRLSCSHRRETERAVHVPRDTSEWHRTLSPAQVVTRMPKRARGASTGHACHNSGGYGWPSCQINCCSSMPLSRLSSQPNLGTMPTN